MQAFNLTTALAASRDQLQASWATALAATGTLIAGSHTLLPLVTTLTDYLLLALAEGPDASSAAEQVGRGLVEAQLSQPAARNATLRVLSATLWELAPDPSPRPLAMQIEQVLRSVALGFDAAARASILSAQEKMRAALLAARNVAEQQQHSAETRLRAVIDVAPLAIALLDPEGVFQLVAGRALQSLRLTPSFFLGKSIYTLFDVSDPVRERLQAALRGEPQYWASTLSGRNLDLSFIPLFENGSVGEVLLLGVDVTEREAALSALICERRKLTERIVEQTAELRALNTDLRAMIQRREAFLATMSHELRTPLTVILGAAELLLEAEIAPVTTDQRHWLTLIERSGQYLLGLINDILDLTKVNAEKLPLTREAVPVEALCAACIQMIRAQAQPKGLELELVLDPQVMYVEGDELRLKQILINLLSNAVKFTPAGGIVRLTTAGDTQSKRALFTVSDTGVGISPEDHARIFQPFEQVNSGQSRANVGTGLGLALVVALAQLHGGGVSVVSTPDVGSHFTLWLPWHTEV